jgi:hypothetical protein
MDRTQMTFTEQQVRVILGSLRGRLEEYEAEADECRDLDDDSYEWYVEQIEELRPLVERFNTAGVRIWGKDA